MLNFHQIYSLAVQSKTLKNPHQLGFINVNYDVSYRFTFISLISPYLVSNLRLSGVTPPEPRADKSTALLKKSYVLYTWFYFLKASAIRPTSTKLVKFSFLPTTRSLYTLTKAPMAHKTNSKEQFVFRFFKLHLSVATRLRGSDRLVSFDQGLLALKAARVVFPKFSTNLLLLKRSRLGLTITDSSFLDFASFSTHSQLRK